MRHKIIIIAMLLFPLFSFANQGYHGDCSIGNRRVVTQGLQSTNTVMASYPGCTVAVYVRGTQTFATIYADNLSSPTPLSNPFTASGNPAITSPAQGSSGSYLFYAADGHYDVVMSGGLNGGFNSPYTIADVLLSDLAPLVPTISPGGALGSFQSHGSTGTFAGEGNVINADQYSGNDMCAKIHAAIIANPGAQIDARSFTGNQNCSSNPFAGATGDVNLLLGEGVVIQTTAPWVTSSQHNGYIHGSGRGVLGTNLRGTTIKAVAGFPSSCAGLIAACPVLRLGDFSDGINGAFGHRIDNLTIDCNSQPQTVGLYSNDIQEQSGAEHFSILQCPVAGVLMDGSYGQGKGAENYVLYDGEVYTFAAGTSSTVGISITGSILAATSARLIAHITVGGPSGAPIGVGYQFIDTTGGAVIGVNSEHATVGYQLGTSGHHVGGITISDAVCGLETTDCVQINSRTVHAIGSNVYSRYGGKYGRIAQTARSGSHREVISHHICSGNISPSRRISENSSYKSQGSSNGNRGESPTPVS